MELLFTLKHVTVESVAVYSDAMDTELTQAIAARLTGCPLRSQALTTPWPRRTTPKFETWRTFFWSSGCNPAAARPPVSAGNGINLHRELWEYSLFLSVFLPKNPIQIWFSLLY